MDGLHHSLLPIAELPIYFFICTMHCVLFSFCSIRVKSAFLAHVVMMAVSYLAFHHSIITRTAYIVHIKLHIKLDRAG